MKEEENDNIDIKGTLKKFVQAEEPELEQEEAIMKYGEVANKKKKKNNEEDTTTDGNTEEQEHLKRVKQELLASLKRVEAMAKKVFEGNPLGDKQKINVKVDKGEGKQSSKSKQKDLSVDSKEKQNSNAKERE